MLYPAVATLLEKVNSRYYLVNIIAQRAREISENAEMTGEHLNVKPVSIAVKEIANGEINVADYFTK